MFPIWVVLSGIIGVLKPGIYDWFKKDYVPLALAITMITMGTSLKVEDFVSIIKAPKRMLIGLMLQYSVMPLLGFLISRIPGMPLAYAAGIVLVSCCPGGTASNIVTYLAKADVALSVSMTAASTLAAALFTPILTSLLLGTLVEVDASGLFISTAQVVLLPVFVGVILNEKFPRVVEKVRFVSPLVAVVVVALICGMVISSSINGVSVNLMPVFCMVYALHSGGFLLGYLVPRALNQPTDTCITICIEVGMQNSTLGAVLAGLHFPDPLTALPCALSAGTHSVLGSLLAGFWRWQSNKGKQK